VRLGITSPAASVPARCSAPIRWRAELGRVAYRWQCPPRGWSEGSDLGSPVPNHPAKREDLGQATPSLGDVVRLAGDSLRQSIRLGRDHIPDVEQVPHRRQVSGRGTVRSPRSLGSPQPLTKAGTDERVAWPGSVMGEGWGITERSPARRQASARPRRRRLFCRIGVTGKQRDRSANLATPPTGAVHFGRWRARARLGRLDRCSKEATLAGGQPACPRAFTGPGAPGSRVAPQEATAQVARFLGRCSRRGSDGPVVGDFQTNGWPRSGLRPPAAVIATDTRHTVVSFLQQLPGDPDAAHEGHRPR